MADELLGIKKDLLLAEYNAVRNTANQKSTAAQTTTAAYITLIAAILGFVVSAKADVRLLLLVPALSSTFAITVSSRYRSRRIATEYIRDVLHPMAVQLGKDSRLLGWDDYYANANRNQPVVYSLGIRILFPLLSIVTLAVTLPALASLTDWVVWSIGVVLLLAFVPADGARKIRQRLRLTRRQPRVKP